MSESNLVAIQNCKRIMTQTNCFRTKPYRSKILKWFDQQQKEYKDYIGKNDLRCDLDKLNPSITNSVRAHTFGLAIGKQCIILAIQTTNWAPSEKVLYDFLNYVINFEGNFVICENKYNLQWRDGGEKTLLKLLKNYSQEQGIYIHKDQVKQLLRVLNAIRKKNYLSFFKKSIQYGVSWTASKKIKQVLQKIHQQARKIARNLQKNKNV